ncbi:MAG: hypothetical protein KME02_08090 [Aphanothece saxicola GSE-SYN-MK-01-06B]|jgi:hypothetical protein|nr:hypothetical protein [Aphanothece saxicola GSE-SYN-MK-01-06B]
MTVLHLPCALTLLLLAGCQPLWNAANQSALKADVRALLKKAAVEPQHLACRMVDLTRNATCTLRMSSSETASVVRTLALKSIQRSSSPPAPHAQRMELAGRSCVAGTTGSIITFGLGNRPGSLRLSSGTAFESLMLSFNQSTGQACVQVSYAYG